MQDEGEDANRLESFALTLIFTAISVALLSTLFIATRHGPATGGWWTRPALAPGVALVVLVLANLMTIARAWGHLRNAPPTRAERDEARARVAGWLRPLEYLGYYAAYLLAIQHLGYLPSTLLFVQFLLWRVGLTEWRWILAGVAFVIGMVLVFRVGLGVWMPAPEFFELFPNAMRMALIRWF